MRAIALPAIQLYKRHLSPYKGFCCAYRSHLGRFSCSTLGFRAIRMYGVIKGIAVLRQRLKRCGVVHRRYKRRAQETNEAVHLATFRSATAAYRIASYRIWIAVESADTPAAAMGAHATGPNAGRKQMEKKKSMSTFHLAAGSPKDNEWNLPQTEA